jgi:hypothetical protein
MTPLGGWWPWPKRDLCIAPPAYVEAESKVVTEKGEKLKGDTEDGSSFSQKRGFRSFFSFGRSGKKARKGESSRNPSADSDGGSFVSCTEN